LHFGSCFLGFFAITAWSQFCPQQTYFKSHVTLSMSGAYAVRKSQTRTIN
jgi:hypothetical protein